jgi:SPP1 gp7 family putative phage head morphogenesis protein
MANNASGQGIIARVSAAMRYAITGNTPTDWFGPLTPLQPQAPPEVRGRAFDYPVGVNLNFIPRSTEAVTFQRLKQFAANPLVAMLLQHQKDLVCGLDWEIKTRKEQAPGATPDAQIQAIKDFLMFPDKEHDWVQWISAVLDQLLVIDAATIYNAPSVGGAPYAFQIIDGANIKPLIDQNGRRPQLPFPAYQEVLKGLPAVNYTTDEILYFPQVYRVDRIYGYSRVEQAYDLIDTAISRLRAQKGYFDFGNIGDGYFTAPETWQNPDNILALEAKWNMWMQGDPSKRRQAPFLPYGVEWHPTKVGMLEDAFDEYLIRLLCFPFGVEPTPFMKQAGLSKGGGAEQKRAAAEAGIAPLMSFVERMVSHAIAKWFGRADLEFVFTADREFDPQVAAQIDDMRLRNGTTTINAIKDRNGEKPIPDGDVVMVFGSGGWQKLDDVLNPPEPPPALVGPDGLPIAPPKPGAPATAPDAAPVGKGPKAKDAPDKGDKLAKYNHNHDAAGKFTMGDGPTLDADGYPAKTADSVKAVMTPEEVAAFRGMIADKAPTEDILAQTERLASSDGASSTLTLTADGKVPDGFFKGRVYNLPDGSQTDVEGAVKYLMAEGAKGAGPNGVVNGHDAILLIGPPAAGKSTLANQLAANGYHIVDADEAKKLIPGYNNGLGASSVHEESAAIAKIWQAQIARSGDNVLAQTTSFNVSSAAMRVDSLHDAGYNVNVVGMQISAGEAVRRMASRAISTGRTIPADNMLVSADKTMRTYQGVKTKGDGYATISSEGRQPQVLDSTIGWIKSGKSVFRKGGDSGGAFSETGDSGGIRRTILGPGDEVWEAFRIHDVAGEPTAADATNRPFREHNHDGGFADDGAVLSKYNRNHDAAGRFTTGDGPSAKQQLTAERDLWQGLNPELGAREQWLLDNGEESGPPIKPDVPMGPKKQCYKNSALAIINESVDPKVWAYTEGKIYMPSLPIAIDHAWLSREDGAVMDLTTADNAGSKYYGIPFKSSFVMSQALKTGYYGIFSDGVRANRAIVGRDMTTKRAWAHTDAPLAKSADGKVEKRLAKTLRDYLAGKRVAVEDEIAAAIEAGDSPVDAIARILASTPWDWSDLADNVGHPLAAAGAGAGADALAELGLFDADVLEAINADTLAFAEARGAELVGKRWVGTKLVDNPDARWVISDSTRDMVRDTLVSAVKEGASSAQFAKAIQDSYAFSSERAESISRTELAFANINGTTTAWKHSGVVAGKQFLAAPGCCDICRAMDGEVVLLDEEFSEGGPPVHPHCRCNVLAVMKPVDDAPQQDATATAE